MRPSLTKKVGLLLFLLWLGAVAALVMFYRYLSASENDTHFVNVAGRQRMLAQRVYLFAGMSQVGREDDRRALQQVTQEFEQSLHALEHGGPVLGGVLSPAVGPVRRALTRVKKIWAEIKPQLRTRPGSPIGAPGPVEAMLERRIPRLTEAAEAVVSAYEAHARARRASALTGFVVTAVLELLLLVVGLWLTRFYISRPVRLLEEATRRVQSGDFSHRVPIVTKDELAVVTGRFNEMSAHLADLLANEERRLREAESHLQRLLNNAPVGIFRVDESGVITLAEGRALYGYGLRLGEQRGKSVFEHFERAPWFPDQVRRALAGDSFVGGGEIDGVHLELRYEPVRADDGQVTGVVGVCAEMAHNGGPMSKAQA